MARGSLTFCSVLASYVSPPVTQAALAGTARVPSEASSSGPPILWSPFPYLPGGEALEGGPSCFSQRLSIHPASLLPVSLCPACHIRPRMPLPPGFRGALLSVTMHKAMHSQARPTFQTMDEVRGSVLGHAPSGWETSSRFCSRAERSFCYLLGQDAPLTGFR